jgi:hypothetical protein
MSVPKRDIAILIRVSHQEKETFEEAAQEYGIATASLVRMLANRGARKILEGKEPINDAEASHA